MPENLPFLLPLPGRGSSARPTSLSQSVTSKRQYRLQMLQIETFPNGAGPLSQSVTSRSDFAELLLQIETNRREHPPFVKTTTKVSMNCPLCDGLGGGLGVCQDKTCQNKPVPFWQVC